jgi:predicted permease
MNLLFADLRYTLRQFRQSPIFTLTAMLTLALGIGGTTAIFSLIHAVMLRSLPVADPASLYRIGDGNDCCVEGGPQDNWGMYTFGLYQQLVAAAPEFEEVAAFQSTPWSFGVLRPHIDQSARSMQTEYVTGNYFSTLGVRAFAGRLTTPADDTASSAPVTVLSYRAWKGTYAGDHSILGSTLTIGGRPFTVIGIAPPGFFGETLRGDPPDFWLPLQQEPLIAGQDSLLRQTIPAWLRVIGRLRPGANVNGMSERLTQVLRRWMQNDAGYPVAWMPEMTRQLPKQHINIVPGGAGVQAMKEDYGRSLQILLGVCGLVLLIACANVANLLLARGMSRRSQTSIRLAIGASRSRIIAQSLAESIMLAIGGGIAGLAVAFGAGRLLVALAFHGGDAMPISAAPSVPVLAFAFALSLITGVLFGVGPAWFATQSNPVEALRGGNRSTRDGSSISRRALLVTQATLSVVLVAGAAMLTRSLGNLEHQNLGLQVSNRILIGVNPPPASYSHDRLNALYRNLEERLAAIPGVDRAGLALYNPFTDNWGELIFVAGGPAASLDGKSVSSWDRISPDYLQTVGQPIVRGRGFTNADVSSAPVAIVNETFVRRFFPNKDPLEKQFGLDMPENAGTFRIIGVARDAKYTDPQGPARPMFFVPLAQYATYQNPLMTQIESRSHFINGAILQAHLPPGVLEPQIRKVFAEADANLTVTTVRTLQDQVDLNFDQQRAVAGLAGLFGIVALILASVGLYGVTAYSVAQRTSEIGLRMALGADRAGVVRLVLRGAFNMVLIGLVLGIPLSIGAGRLLSAQLYGVTMWDPIALSIAIASLGICALFAALAPAARAAAIDPMRALRTE